MKLVKFENVVSIEKLVGYYGEENLSMDDFNGNGVYRVKVGCRGEVEFVEKVSDNEFVEIKEEEDLLMEEFVQEEFVISEFVDWDIDYVGIKYVEGWGEEDYFEYYMVEV